MSTDYASETTGFIAPTLFSRLLHSDRDPIPDVPAIYFVMPTEENIDRICQVNVNTVTVRLNKV